MISADVVTHCAYGWPMRLLRLLCLAMSCNLFYEVPQSEARQLIPLTFDDGARTQCYQHIGQTAENIAKGKRIEVSHIKSTNCGVHVERNRTCTNRGLWRNGSFSSDGSCPAWFVQTFNWTAGNFGQTPGWHFSASTPVANDPLLISISNYATNAEDPCRHHEVNFNYNFPGISFVAKEGRGPRLIDYQDILVAFAARVTEVTNSKCNRLRRALVKLSIVLRWYDQIGKQQPRRKPTWQSSIAVILFDADSMIEQLEARKKGKGNSSPIFFDNRCGRHRLWQNKSCMISLDGTDLGLPELDGSMRQYNFSLTDLVNSFGKHLSPAGLDIRQAEIKSVQVVSAVNGADLTFELQNPRVLGVR